MILCFCSPAFVHQFMHVTYVAQSKLQHNRVKFDKKMGSKHVKIILKFYKIRCVIRRNDSYIVATQITITPTCCPLRADMIVFSINLATVGHKQNRYWLVQVRDVILLESVIRLVSRSKPSAKNVEQPSISDELGERFYLYVSAYLTHGLCVDLRRHVSRT